MPGKVQQVKESGMAADCQRQRGENWRRNSGGGSSFQQNPPAIPAPPPDPQDNLTRGSTDQIQFIENETLKNRSSVSPVLSRTRIRSRVQPETNSENAAQENSYPPPGRRSRARPSEGQIVTTENGESGVSDHSRMRTRSRSRISEDGTRISTDEVSPSSASNVSSPSTTRVRERNRQDNEISNPVPLVENAFPPPGRVRSRSRPSEPQSDERNSVGQESTSFTPRIRTRSRSRANEMSQNDTTNMISDSVPNQENSQPVYGRMRSRSRPSQEIQKDLPVGENSYPASFRTRSRSRASREEEQRPVERLQSSPNLEQKISLPPVGRRQREQETENLKNDANIEITETIPLRSRDRNRSTQNDQNQNDNVSQSQTVRERSRSRNNEIIGENNMETPESDNQVVSPPVQTVTIRLRKRPKKQEPDESVKIPQEITNGNAATQIESQTNSLEANDSESKEDETTTVTIRRRAREPKPEPPENEESKPEETATVTIRRRSRPLNKEENLVKEEPEEEREEKVPEKENIEEEKSFSQENEATGIQTTQNDQPKPEENQKPLATRDVFFPETMKSEIVVRKRSSSPAPVTKQDSSPFSRRRSDQNEECRNSSSPAPISLKQEASPLARKRSEENDERRNSASPAPPSLKQDASPLARRRSEQKEEIRHSPSPIPPKANVESPRSTRQRNQSSLEKDNEKSTLLNTKEQSSLDEDKNETSAESMENNSFKAKPEVVPIKLKLNESLSKENLEPSVEAAESVDVSQKDKVIPLENEEIPQNLSEIEFKIKSNEIPVEKIESDLPKMQEKILENELKKETENTEGIKEDKPSELLKNVMVSEDEDKKDIKNHQINSENMSDEIEIKRVENQTSSGVLEKENENLKEDKELPSNILKIDIKEDDWEKKVLSEKEKKNFTTDLVTDSSKDRHKTEGETSEKEINQNLSGLTDLDKNDKQESNAVVLRQESTEEEKTKEEEPQSHEETDEEEEDPIAKATRLWLLSKNQNSDILEKVLPEIDSSNVTKTKRSPERDVELLDPDEVINQGKEVKPQMIEEWNDDFKEEPKNFTSFTSIKLKSRPPKSPPDKKSGRIISKDESSSEIPSAPPPPPPPPPGPKKSKSKSGIPRPPPPPSSAPLSEKELRVKKAREKMVDRIKRAARSRPDWKSVMKDIEGGAKLRKVSSSDKLDRSNPILPKSRGKGGKFFYESEKPVVQNQLLGEIQRGVKLRHVKTNDRSKPDFAKLGLRKLRRQLTVEEKKSISSNTPDALPSSSDEEEDIDQMRDDLASTKTQLAEEIKKNKKLETEQKILQIDLQSLQAEVKKLKRKLKEAGVHEAKPLTNGEAEALAPKLSKSMSKLRMMEEDLDFSELDTIEKDIQLLNDQIEVQKKRAEIAEVKCDELNQKLQVSQTSCDEWEMRSVYFEKKYKTLQKDQGIELPEIDCSGTQTDPIEMGPAKSDSSTGLYTKKSGSRKSFASVSRMQSFKEEDESDDESSSSSEEDTLSDHQGDEDEDEERDSEEEDEDDLKGSCADMEKREEREFIMWKNRLSHMKDKVKNVRKERNNLRERVKKFFSDMRLERKEYLKLKAELKDLLDQMKEDEDVIEEEDEEEESEEEEEEIAQDEEAPDWWTDETPQKPKKLKKRKKKQKENEDEDENIVDMSGLEDPQWSDSDQEESESEEEDENTANRIKSLKERTKNLEENMNAKRKETYQLKSKIDQCEEMIAEEKRRHARLENELHMLLADI